MDRTLTTLKETNTKKERNELLEHFYYKKRCFNDLSIRLSSKHIPIHPKMKLERQKDYNQYIERNITKEYKKANQNDFKNVVKKDAWS